MTNPEGPYEVAPGWEERHKDSQRVVAASKEAQRKAAEEVKKKDEGEKIEEPDKRIEPELKKGEEAASEVTEEEVA